MSTQHTSEPSKLVIAGSDYHVNSGTIRTLVKQRDELIAALERVGATASVLHHNSGRVDAALLATMVKGIADEASAAIAAAEGSKCSVAAAKAETSVT